jgi:ABC-2 type transport system ATP-binding protein
VRTVTVYPATDTDRAVVKVGDELVIDVELESIDGMAEWVCGIQIDNASGQLAYATTTKRMEVDLGQLRGTRRLRFRLHDTRFGPGKYFVNVALTTEAGVHVHDWPQAASFDAEDYRVAIGIISAFPTVEDLTTDVD